MVSVLPREQANQMLTNRERILEAHIAVSGLGSLPSCSSKSGSTCITLSGLDSPGSQRGGDFRGKALVCPQFLHEYVWESS